MITAEALPVLELRDKSFDLALAVIEAERAEQSQSASADYWRLRSRSLARQLMHRIARDGARAAT